MKLYMFKKIVHLYRVAQETLMDYRLFISIDNCEMLESIRGLKLAG